MRFLLDANLSPALVRPLVAGGYDAVHVKDVGLLAASDSVIFDYAGDTGCVVVTADSDFPTMLALRRAMSPSVVLLRHINELARDAQCTLLLANLPAVLHYLEQGAIVSLSPTRLAIRALPIA